ncbi:DNA primase family protein [Mycobacteroides salmoniphilum]|uniref:DNA primase family protein n=1 Tax=Mycobacteroides salmoniphilum TaxID=404941 RepID=UPI000992AF44|nr:phage/plasmid primase, P4 family [Mycobacteroides salmoniphilum]
MSADVHAITYDDIEGAVQLRGLTYRKPSRARRFISQCPACESREPTLTVNGKLGGLTLQCDNDCAPLDVIDALKVDGILHAPMSPDDLSKPGSQVRIAYIFAEMFAGKVIHADGLGWYYYSGKHWAEDRGDKRVREYVLRTLRRARSDSIGDPDLLKAAQRCETANAIRGVLDIAASLREIRVEVEDLDADPYLLNCANGTFDLRELELRPHSPDDLITKITEAAYHETARGTGWEAFLERVLPNEEVREYLQRLAGVALLGTADEHCLPLLTGQGRNGKGVWYMAMLHMLGDYGYAANPDLFVEGRTSADARVSLRGRRMIVVSETDKGAKLAEATVKRLTGGDIINARQLYRSEITFMPSHLAFMVTNHPPVVSGSDTAIWERLRVIRFDVVIPPEERDTGLGDKLKLEADAILAWAIQGLADYQTMRGLNAPDEVQVATAAYQAKSDVVGRFLSECTTSVAVHKISMKDLYDRWTSWAASEGVEPVGKHAFNESLRERGHRTLPSGGREWWQGISLAVALT